MAFRSLCRRALRGAAVLALALSLLACGETDTAESTAPTPDSMSGAMSGAMPDTMSVGALLRTDDRFTTLVTALDSARLDSLLTHDGPYTLFAPPNAAFERLPPGTVEDLLSERQDRLRTILRYHLVEGRVRADGVTGPDTLTTLSGHRLPVGRPDTAVVVNGDVSVLASDINVANGIVHVIENVLRPPEDDER